MKRIIVVILLNFIFSYSSGQFYIQPSVGYTFSSHPIVDQSIVILDNQKTVYETKIKYGEGMHLNLNVGYDLTDYLIIELAMGNTIYSRYNVSTVQPDLQSLSSFSTYGYFGEIDYESSVFQVSPQIGYKAKKNKFSTYFKMGPDFMKAYIKQTYRYINWELDDWEFYPLNTVKEYEFSGKFHIGLQANIGVCYSIHKNLQILLDLVTVYNNYKITNAKPMSFS